MSDMSKFKVELPNIRKSTKHMASSFFKAAKHYPIDAALCIITLIAIILWAFNVQVYLEGAAAILVIYAYGVTRGKYANKMEIEKLKHTKYATHRSK